MKTPIGKYKVTPTTDTASLAEQVVADIRRAREAARAAAQEAKA
jgi:hypothetical protein